MSVAIKPRHAVLKAPKLSVDDCSTTHLRTYLEQSAALLKQAFVEKHPVRELIQARSKHLDKLLVALWQHFKLSDALTLIAVGGYGRGELHPHSDVDLLILSKKKINKEDNQKISEFITLLWDCRLKVGHAVRELKQCVTLAADDVTVATNIMESRFLIGNQALYDDLKHATRPDKIWDAKSFFRAKTDEQIARYKRFDGSSFDLEPNLKSSPGGLRDIHVISWVAQRIYYPKTLDELISLGVITQKEYYTLVKCQLFLWQVRYALHLVANKPEDRLLFDYQTDTARLMGFRDTKNSLAVEKLMKKYYRSVLIIRNLCDILLQSLEEDLFSYLKRDKPVQLDDHFQLINWRVDAIDPKIFLKESSQLLKVFHHVALNPKVRGITARTQRAMRAARYKINTAYRHNTKNKKLFVDFWRIAHTESRAMFLMKRSGILADFLPAFEKISGQMQYDLFHNYTVDEHTLFLLKNLTHFLEPVEDEANAPFPVCRQIMRELDRPWLIFLAGLFHDIGKGRGGDHSEIGAIEARKFCQSHGLSEEDSEVISWLVANHLLMSLTAQKRDISDPRVVGRFAELVQDPHKLSLLYVLTVADIRATSNNLWNGWKDSLLRELYESTLHQLQASGGSEERWLRVQQRARDQLLNNGVAPQAIDELWQYLDQDYFSRRSVRDIVWQTSEIIKQQTAQQDVVALRSTRDKSGSEVFVYTKDRENLFALLTAILNRQGLSIQSARIFTDNHHYCYDSFIVLDEKATRLRDKQRRQHVVESLRQALGEQSGEASADDYLVQRRMPRQLKYFAIKTKVGFDHDEFSGLTRLELIARDRPGLLAAVGNAFRQCQIILHDAKITTLGERVEDIFVVSHQDNTPVEDPVEQDKIRQTIIQYLDRIG